MRASSTVLLLVAAALGRAGAFFAPAAGAPRRAALRLRAADAADAAAADAAADPPKPPQERARLRAVGGVCPGEESLPGWPDTSTCARCDGTGKIAGGLGAVLPFIPVAAYRPCPDFIEAGGVYKKRGQSLDQIAFGGDKSRQETNFRGDL